MPSHLLKYENSIENKWMNSLNSIRESYWTLITIWDCSKIKDSENDNEIKDSEYDI